VLGGVPALSLGLQMLRERAQRIPPSQRVRVVDGWTGAQFAEKRLPTVSDLNAAPPDTPLLVRHLYQSAILNRSGAAALGYAGPARRRWLRSGQYCRMVPAAPWSVGGTDRRSSRVLPDCQLPSHEPGDRSGSQVYGGISARPTPRQNG
jgi:hypothetical protein